MLKRFQILLRFIKFYFRAKTKYRVHSPFVFDFVNEVLEDDRTFYVFREAEILRGQLLESKDSVQVTDFGAGSHVDGTKRERAVRSIAASALSQAFQCEWIFRICNNYKPLNIIELGTSLGVSTLYISEGTPSNAKILTLEGSSEIAKIANRNFDWFYNTFNKTGMINNDADVLNYETYQKNMPTGKGKNKIQIIEGTFDKTLQLALNQLVTLDLCFIDGNHRYAPTMQYFEQCLRHKHEGTILIFDDIHWSEEMERAWEEVKLHPSVKLTIDLFWCGIVFFRNENQEKEHFSLVKASWKPFSWGLFR